MARRPPQTRYAQSSGVRFGLDQPTYLI